MKLAAVNDVSQRMLDVFVIDDNQLTLDIVDWILKSSGLRYQLSNDPKEALNTLTSTATKILIVDYYMPDANGLELLEQFKVLPDAANTTVYLCTAVRPMPEQVSQLTELGGQLIDKEMLCSRADLINLINKQVVAING